MNLGSICSGGSTVGLLLSEQRKRCSLSFPKRVLVPWLAAVFICDYLQPSETFEDVKDHCKEMMSMVVPTDMSAILEVETEASPLTAKSFWDAIHGNSAPESHNSTRKSNKDSTREVGTAKSKYSNLNIVTALAILLLSILNQFSDHDETIGNTRRSPTKRS